MTEQTGQDAQGTGRTWIGAECSPELKQDVQDAADRLETQVSTIVRWALRDWLRAQKAAPQDDGWTQEVMDLVVDVDVEAGAPC